MSDQPAYDLDAFLESYPQFGPSGSPEVWTVPQVILEAYVSLAHASLSQRRWQDMWAVGIGLYIAHFATLYLRGVSSAGSSAQTVAAMGMTRGVQVSKSAGGVSTSYQILGAWEKWGAWNLTIFGQQFIQMANIVGMGAVVV